jgi:Na+/proline symporter
MKLLNKPFGEYLRFTKVGIGLLLLVSVVRFMLWPMFQIPYQQGTNFASVTILLPILMVVYAVMVARSGGSYRDLLGVAMALALPTTLFIILGIAIDDFGGIDTYYTDPAHGGNLNPWAHMGGHIVFSGIVVSLVLWGIGSLVNRILAGNRKKAMA